MAAHQNIVGMRIRALRREQGLTQGDLAARCGMLGWDIGENTVTKIETQIRCVTDAELLCIATVLGVQPDSIFPPSGQMKQTVRRHFTR